METDFISREAAWNGIYNCPTKRDADGYIWVRTSDVAHMIDDIPAADVVEVVRCGECKYWYDNAPTGYDTGACGLVIGITNANFFCADGKRRCPNERRERILVQKNDGHSDEQVDTVGR